MTMRGKNMLAVNSLVIDDYTGAAYLSGRAGKSSSTAEANVIVDYDDSGKMIGIEFTSWPLQKE